MHTELASLIPDVFVLLDIETSAGGGEKKDDRERFRVLLKDAEKFLPEGTLKERLEIETLGDVGILKNQRKFFNTVVKLKTKLL